MTSKTTAPQQVTQRKDFSLQKQSSTQNSAGRTAAETSAAHTQKTN